MELLTFLSLAIHDELLQKSLCTYLLSHVLT